VKLKTKLSLFSSAVPASVMVDLSPSKKLENATIVKFTAANLGIGPLQVRECQKKLDGVKEGILADLEALAQMKVELKKDKEINQEAKEKTAVLEDGERVKKKIKTKNYSLTKK
jgi:hypothetical protein